MPPRNFWLRQGITFYPAEGLFAYGLKTQSNGTKSILMCVQAYLIKHLIFDNKQQQTKQKGKPGLVDLPFVAFSLHTYFKKKFNLPRYVN